MPSTGNRDHYHGPLLLNHAGGQLAPLGDVDVDHAVSVCCTPKAGNPCLLEAWNMLLYSKMLSVQGFSYQSSRIVGMVYLASRCVVAGDCLHRRITVGEPR